jgi:hypothetical protein
VNILKKFGAAGWAGGAARRTGRLTTFFGAFFLAFFFFGAGLPATGTSSLTASLAALGTWDRLPSSRDCQVGRRSEWRGRLRRPACASRWIASAGDALARGASHDARGRQVRLGLRLGRSWSGQSSRGQSSRGHGCRRRHPGLFARGFRLRRFDGRIKGFGATIFAASTCGASQLHRIDLGGIDFRRLDSRWLDLGRVDRGYVRLGRGFRQLGSRQSWALRLWRWRSLDRSDLCCSGGAGCGRLRSPPVRPSWRLRPSRRYGLRQARSFNRFAAVGASTFAGSALSASGFGAIDGFTGPNGRRFDDVRSGNFCGAAATLASGAVVRSSVTSRTGLRRAFAVTAKSSVQRGSGGGCIGSRPAQGDPVERMSRRGQGERFRCAAWAPPISRDDA